ncbi:uncharacterized protein LOC133300857 [Gastrolobium bilobum]|uniref:uncharacterized protein LOC133300857 n=1 Tax=Gastrolobium bilobum TaxID=150636 RepID=UPI002AB2B892|nr:uncharacterized protein LOC133300857 [Gastrolobium bilobum]
MEHKVVLKLFDCCWFELEILKNNSCSSMSTSYSENLNHQIKEESSEPKLIRIKTTHTRRSMSDQSMTSFNNDSLSPDSVLLPAKLQTILSGKEVTDSESENPAEMIHHEVLLPKKNIINNGRKKRERKSLSDLEFEELKGFMDLGFVFTEEDKDSSLASTIPGLQRLGKKEEEEDDSSEDDSDESVIPRPYLSEAWECHYRRKKENPLMNWEIPAMNSETDMKDSLRWWAHTVASSVR